MKAAGPWMNRSVQMGRRLVFRYVVVLGLFDDLLADFTVSEEEDSDDHQQDDEQRDIDESVTDV
jgi:hypothetical protein